MCHNSHVLVYYGQLVTSLSYVGSRNQTQVFRLGRECPGLMLHLPSPGLMLHLSSPLKLFLDHKLRQSNERNNESRETDAFKNKALLNLDKIVIVNCFAFKVNSVSC